LHLYLLCIIFLVNSFS